MWHYKNGQGPKHPKQAISKPTTICKAGQKMLTRIHKADQSLNFLCWKTEADQNLEADHNLQSWREKKPTSIYKADENY